jgi:hypothetical protein
MGLSHHILFWQVIPKVRNGLTQLSKAKEEHKPLLGHLLYVAAQVGLVTGCKRTCRVGRALIKLEDCPPPLAMSQACRALAVPWLHCRWPSRRVWLRATVW